MGSIGHQLSLGRVRHALACCVGQLFSCVSSVSAILPQLLSRLSHPDVNVRGSVTELVRRIAVDCPYLVIYPAVVSCPLPVAADSKQQQGNESEPTFIETINRIDEEVDQ